MLTFLRFFDSVYSYLSSIFHTVYLIFPQVFEDCSFYFLYKINNVCFKKKKDPFMWFISSKSYRNIILICTCSRVGLTKCNTSCFALTYCILRLCKLCMHVLASLSLLLLFTPWSVISIVMSLLHSEIISPLLVMIVTIRYNNCKSFSVMSFVTPVCYKLNFTFV